MRDIRWTIRKLAEKERRTGRRAGKEVGFFIPPSVAFFQVASSRVAAEGPAKYMRRSKNCRPRLLRSWPWKTFSISKGHCDSCLGGGRAGDINGHGDECRSSTNGMGNGILNVDFRGEGWGAVSTGETLPRYRDWSLINAMK